MTLLSLTCRTVNTFLGTLLRMSLTSSLSTISQVCIGGGRDCLRLSSACCVSPTVDAGSVADCLLLVRELPAVVLSSLFGLADRVKADGCTALEIFLSIACSKANFWPESCNGAKRLR